MGCFVTGCNISIGHHSVINRRCYLDGRIGIEIGNNVGISPEVYIISLTHDPDDKQFHTAGAKVVIEDRVWIGARAMLMPGVKLSEGCVVGAGSVVTKSFAPYSIVAGVPAKFIRERKRNDSYELNYFPLFDTDITL
jgi:acetyltransferase-like isoleucine patch superfamily enzyme